MQPTFSPATFLSTQPDVASGSPSTPTSAAQPESSNDNASPKTRSAIKLRQVELRDIATLRALVESGNVRSFMSQWMPRAASAGIICAETTLWQIILLEDQIIGSIWIERPSPADSCGALGIFIGIESLRGKGIGRQVIATAETLARETWQLQSVRLNVREANERARRCYEAAGYHIFGQGEKISPEGSLRYYKMVHDLCPPAP